MFSPMHGVEFKVNHSKSFRGQPRSLSRRKRGPDFADQKGWSRYVDVKRQQEVYLNIQVLKRMKGYGSNASRKHMFL